MEILGFDWDDINTEKIAAHDLEADDVEWLFEDGDPCFLPHPKDPERTIVLGFAPDERFVLVVCEYDEETRWVRVVTAYEPTAEIWWRRYARAKGFGKAH